MEYRGAAIRHPKVLSARLRYLGGYGGKQGPELLGHRLALYGEQRLAFGANNYRHFARLLAPSTKES